MAPFQTERFLKDIKHVDKDLRLMALFDLRRFLPTADEAAITNEVVERTLACLKPDERCEEVQNEAANVLPIMVVKCQQREDILLRLLEKVTQVPPSNDNESRNLQYMCGMSFKKSCTEFSEEARRNIVFWQRHLNVARGLCKGCAAHLASDALAEATREILYSAVNALVPAYRDALDDRAALLTLALRDFRSVVSVRHASLTLIESLIASVDAATRDALLDESAALLSAASTGERYVAYLQLCEAALKAVRGASLPALKRVYDSVCGRLQHATEQYDGVEDSSEVLLEVLDSLLQLGAGERGLDRSVGFAAVRDLVSFDPYATSAEAEPMGAEDYDDEYDEYYDYGNDVVDSTWKLRMGAVRVVQTLVSQSDDKTLGTEALALVAGTLQDKVQVVQLEGVKLLRAVVRRQYARDARCTALLTSRCAELCGLLEYGDDKTLTAVVKALEDVFETLADCRPFCEATLPLLLDRVRAASAAFAHNTSAVESLRCIVASVLAQAHNGPLYSATAALSALLPGLCAAAARSESAAGSLTRVGVTACAAYAATKDASIADCLGSEYGALIANTACPAGCRAAAAESVARCIAAHGLVPVEKTAPALWAALEAQAVQLPALRAVHIIASSDVASAALPPAVLTTVEGLLSSQSSAVRLAAAEVLRSRLAAPSAAPLDAAHLQRLAQLYAAGSRLSLATCELGELPTLALLLRQLVLDACRLGTGSGFYGAYVAPMWAHLSRLAVAVAFNRPLLDAALEGVVGLLSAVHAHDASSRAAVERDLAEFLTRDQAHLTVAFTLVRCIAADAANAFLATLSARIAGNSHFLLCVGEAGKEAALDGRWCELLLESVTSTQGEEVRSCGEVALSYSILNPANAATVLLPCGRRAADATAAGRYYYVKAVKEAATLALSRRATTAFHRKDICEQLLSTFLGAAAGADLEELYGACVGVLSAFMVEAGESPRIAQYFLSEDAALETRVTCMVALRHFLSALAERGASVQVYRATVLQALLQLKRPSNPKESTAPSLPLRSMALRLLTAVLQTHPQWLLCEETRANIFPNLLIELREDATLQGTLDLSGYTHRVDKGLECRKLAFEALSAVLRAERQHGVDLAGFCSAKEAVVDVLIVACSAHSKGDRDSSINDTAKELLMRFVERNPGYAFTAPQLDALIDKLGHDIKSGASPTDAQKTTLLFTVKCVMRLSTMPAFAYHSRFQEVAEVARTSGLLAQSLKL